MFNLFQKNQNVLAPISGKVIALEEVPDAAFAQRIVGDGAALDELAEDIVYAPVSGMLSLIFRTNHAFAITTDEQVELLVHVGMDTVKLDGKGFDRLIEPGVRVKAGEPILRIDRELIRNEGYSLITPVVITSVDKVKKIEGKVGQSVRGGKDALFSYK